MHYQRMERRSWLEWATHAAGAAALLVLIGLYWCLYHAPAQRQIAADRERADQLRQLLQSAATIQQEHAQVLEQYELVQLQVDRIHRGVPAEPEDAKFLAMLADIATDEGLKMVGYHQVAKRELATHSEIELVIKCEGGYGELCRFVDRLSQLPRVHTVHQLSLRSDTPRGAYPFEVHLVVYHRLVAKAPTHQETAS